jgi:hypothetical protein
MIFLGSYNQLLISSRITCEHKRDEQSFGIPLNHVVGLFEFASGPHVEEPEKGCDYPDVIENA